MNNQLKKILLSLLLVIGITLIATVVYVANFMNQYKAQLKTLTPVETKKIVANIFTAQDLYSNMYLVKDGAHYIAIDTGISTGSISVELQKLKINPESVVAVLLTHSDPDHVGGLSLFKNAKIYISQQEEQMINGKKARALNIMKNSIGNKHYALITDAQKLTIGKTTIQGILTPGHTPGSMSYLINGKYLFTGDAVSIKAGKIGPFNALLNMDTKTAITSLEKTTKTPGVTYIFSAHYGYTKVN